MNPTFRENYASDLALKRKFIEFLIHIHRLDLSLWDKTGFWDANHRPFSYFEGDKLIASLSVYSMDMTINRQRCRVAQISGVGTLEEYRRRGLNFELTQKALEWARPRHDFFYLFADLDAEPFYAKCGFRKVLEYKPRFVISGATTSGVAEKLDMNNEKHRDLIYRIASERAPVSDILGVHTPKLFMFWCLYFLKDNVYYIREIDTLVLFERKDGVLTIFDVVGRAVPDFGQLYPYICDDSDTAVEFEFMPDKMNMGTPPKLIPAESNGTHLMGEFPLENQEFLFPLTAHA